MSTKKTEKPPKLRVIPLAEAKQNPELMRVALHDRAERVQLTDSRNRVVMDLLSYGGKSGRGFDD